MSAASKDVDRHMIPRWRDARTTGALGELDSATEADARILGGDDLFEEKVDTWNQQHGLGFAGDLVGSALVLGRFEEADEAAKFILSKKDEASTAMYAIAARLLEFEKPPPLDNKLRPSEQRPLLISSIQQSRNKLRDDPRNAFAWTDLARAYTSLGADEKAKRAMRMAISLAGYNRFVLRAASRLAIHVNDQDKAHDLLRRNPRTPDDPWLLASEIAAADLVGRTSRFIKRGREFISSGRFSPFHVAELATSIASIDLKSGNAKAARKLFEAALRKPTENSLAQIEWASERVSGIVINQDQFEIPYSHEARALYSHSAADWLTAVDESEHWLSDEPFASRPAVFGSFIAAEHLEDFERSERICREGLIASPNDATLVNNLAFALANQGKVSEAKIQLDTIPTTGAETGIEICRDATQGFIAFRSGDYSRGREYYQQAIEKAAASNMTSLKVRASIHFAREELSIDTQNAANILKQALRMVKPMNDPDSIGVLQRLLVALQAQTKVEGQLDKIITEVGQLLKGSKPRLRTRPTAVQHVKLRGRTRGSDLNI